MKSMDKEKLTRRDWMQWAGRGSLAAGIGALGALLISRSDTDSSGNACGRKISCKQCRDEKQCYLPRAIAARGRKDQS